MQDSDDLADGVEYLIGANPNLPDSDNDGIDDDDEFFINAVSYDAPCDGPNIRCLGVIEAIFSDGFE